MRIGILVMLGLMLSCNGSKQSASNAKSQASLELNGNYKVVNMNGKAVDSEGLEIIFDASANSINASTSCNKAFGSYTQNGSELSFGVLGATKMYCEGRMEMETEMMQGLSAVNKVSQQEDGSLALMNGDQILMQLRKID